ncbi:MAG: recombinase family protein [Bacteroidota bacterium]
MEAKKSVGIWIRVSTENQVKDDSPEHHEHRARLYAEAKGWQVAEVYRLDAVSGKSVIEQPEAKRMMSDIKSGRITGLIFSKLARLARNTKELLDFADFFKSYQADLISLAESIDTSSPAGRLFYTMIAAMATWEREEIAARVAASVPDRAQLGKPLGGAAPFGYQWKGINWNGEKFERKEFCIDEKEAPVRTLVYELFLKYKRKKTVATKLNSLGYRTRNGSKFSDTTIHRLLRDTTAKGQRIANHTKSLGEGKRWVGKPQGEWIVIPCGAIISEETWNDANAILDAQSAKRKKPGRQVVHLLSGYVTCTCGSKMYVFHKSPSYSCKKCKTKIAVADIDEIYHAQLKSFLLSDSDISDYMQKSNSILQEKEILLSHTSNEIAKIGKRMTDLVNMRLDGDLTKEAFLKEHRPFEERYVQLEKQLPILEAEVDFLRIQSLSADTVLDDAKNLADHWEMLPFEEKRTIVEVITESVTVGKSDIHIALSYLPTAHPSLNSGKRQHNFIPALPFSRLDMVVGKPLGIKYIANPTTLGQKIRNRRLEKGMLQKEVAALIGVTEDCVTLWENGRSRPSVAHYPWIIEFLGHFPFEIDTSTLGGKMKRYRYLKGMTQKGLAKEVGVNESTVHYYENNPHTPLPRTLGKLQALLVASSIEKLPGY